MAAFSSIIAAAGLGLAAAGTVTQVIGQRKAQAGAERAEKIREAQMTIEGTRERRSIVRQALAARAAAVNNASSQGVLDSSGLAGGLSQITSQAGNSTTASNQNSALGAGVFSANRQIARANSQASLGSGLSSLGGALVNNAETIGRLGTYAAG